MGAVYGSRPVPIVLRNRHNDLGRQAVPLKGLDSPIRVSLTLLEGGVGGKRLQLSQGIRNKVRGRRPVDKVGVLDVIPVVGGVAQVIGSHRRNNVKTVRVELEVADRFNDTAGIHSHILVDPDLAAGSRVEVDVIGAIQGNITAVHGAQGNAADNALEVAP